MRMRGVDCGRCGAWVVEEPLGERVLDGVACRRSGSSGGSSGARRVAIGGVRPCRVGLQSAAVAPARHARSGGRRRPGTRCAGCARRARTGSIASRSCSGRVARRSWSHRAEPTMSAERSVEQLEVGRRGRAARDAARRSRRAGAVPIRHGIVLPHASSAQKRVSSRARSTTQARSSATTTEPEPTWAPAARSGVEVYGVSSASAGRSPPDGPPTSTALSVPAAPAARRRARRSSRSGVPSGTSATPRRAAPRTWTRTVPGRVGRRRSPRTPPRPLREDPGHGGQGLDVLDDRRACRTGRARPGAAAAARAGRACPRGPSAGRSPRPACRRPGRAGPRPMTSRPRPSDVVADEAGVLGRADGRRQPA